MVKPLHATSAAMFLFSFGLILFELVLTRLFGVVLFASFAHLALALAMLGISIGAVLQHLRPSLVPDEGLEERLGWLAALQALTTIAAVFAVLYFPVTVQFEEPPAHYGERSGISWELVNPYWFSLLLPALAVPFTIAGLAFAGTFQRRKESIGLLYGADLIGGAIGALMFVPLLMWLPGPDTAFVVVASCALAAALLWASVGLTRLATGAAAVLAVSLIATLAAGAGVELIKVKYSAGYSEENVTFTQWTPLTRLAVHEDKRGAYVLLDNSSASLIVTTEAERAETASEPNRSLVYRLHDPPARIAILAASAGPEVASAQLYGHTGIEAIDIAAIGAIVAKRFPDSPVNPYVIGDTKALEVDGRAAILHAKEPYDIIQMVHANLHSSAGLMSNAWSPALLETVEAFETYFDRLTPDGTLSFGRGGQTPGILRSAAEALRRRGVKDPERHIVYVRGRATFMLVKPRPWTQAERDKVATLLADYRSQHIALDPMTATRKDLQAQIGKAPLMTDDRPYLDTPEKAYGWLTDGFKWLVGSGESEVAAPAVIYYTLAIQTAFTLVAGVLLLIVPLARTSAQGLTQLTGVAGALLYVCCLGYGYLAVETVLIHDLVLFVGHPTYALTTVILTMLLLSGIGSVLVQRIPDASRSRALHGALVGVLVLGALQGFIVPTLLHAYALGLPLGLRIAITAITLTPLSLLMGMPFSLGMRILRPEAAGIVPWAWALNGWMSVVASLSTVLISRLYGYTASFGIALGAYLLALALAHRMAKVDLRG